MTSISGTCLCGQITVSIPKEALNATGATGMCHCMNCRKVSGSLASINLTVPESSVQITGEPKIYQVGNTDSGATVPFAFCGTCSSPIYSAPPRMPGMKIIKLGLFDEIPKPSMEIFCRSRPVWNKPIDGAKQFNTHPTN